MDRRVKRIGCFLAAMLVMTGVMLTGMHPCAGEAIPGVLRLHIRAQSDSARDQRLKMIVREQIAKEFGDVLGGCGSYEEAGKKARALKGPIRYCALRTLRGYGSDAAVSVTVCRETFPVRRYGTQLFPAGEYMALSVNIGEGKGRNWWCVVFPPLCFCSGEKIDETGAGTDGEAIILKSRICEWLKERNWPRRETWSGEN